MQMQMAKLGLLQVTYLNYATREMEHLSLFKVISVFVQSIEISEWQKNFLQTELCVNNVKTLQAVPRG